MIVTSFIIVDTLFMLRNKIAVYPADYMEHIKAKFGQRKF